MLAQAPRHRAPICAEISEIHAHLRPQAPNPLLSPFFNSSSSLLLLFFTAAPPLRCCYAGCLLHLLPKRPLSAPFLGKHAPISAEAAVQSLPPCSSISAPCWVPPALRRTPRAAPLRCCGLRVLALFCRGRPRIQLRSAVSSGPTVLHHAV